MHEVEAFHRGVSVRVKLDEPLRVREHWGDRVTVSIVSLHGTFNEIPTADDFSSMSGDGYQVNKDGTVGRRWRSNVGVSADDIPRDVRELVAHAVDEEWRS